jgi:preprotein translocase subunit SecG
MFGIVLFIHIVVCVGLMIFVLLQAGKGAGLGGAFGGSDAQFFGGKGATTFLSKLTIGCAVLFMFTSLILAVLSARRIEAQKSIIQEKAAQEGTLPATKAVTEGVEGISDLGLTPLSGEVTPPEEGGESDQSQESPPSPGDSSN